MKDSKGWDGKMRVDNRAVITNPEAVEDPEYSDAEAPPAEQIEADEGMPSQPTASSVRTAWWKRSLDRNDADAVFVTDRFARLRGG